MFSQSKSRGFTLIELLVVVAIIAILVSIIAGSLKVARNKTKDDRIMSDIRQLRALIESSLTSDGVFSDIIPAVSPATTGTWNTASLHYEDIDDLVKDLSKLTTTGLIKNLGIAQDSYMLSAKLLSPNPVKYFCMDDTGTVEQTASVLAVTTLACP